MRRAAVMILGLAACAPMAPNAVRPDYLGVQTDLLDGDLVNFRVALRGTDDPALVENYAECAAAQYALIRGQAFTRLVRVNTSKEGGTWRSDAVYTISPDLPRGRASIDAVVKVADCGASGIPTV
ncbi:hypothetical protein AN189_09340 [Loktanella sp. 3ANDIMAR09]|uniref:hypothetical protein n=1 Tax=Loktanella sp. 3ANDIMAR09 TaxID=1225657 RepID=UPI0006FCB289|nr:hypothetical protein [Loktanella sp. 3ANDIMAR09]KQI68510.1 hypothetical protein AN189_09340 [Loktanella sp. 3ANDIMAR09]